MNRSLKYVLLGFGLLVALNYFVIAAQGFFEGLTLFPTENASAQERPYTYDGLPSVNFNFFSPDQIGKSYITQGYGNTSFAAQNENEYPGSWHDGIDIAAYYGEPVYAGVAGTIIATGNQDNFCYLRAFGKYVAMRETNGSYVFWFAHLGNIDVTPNEVVTPATQIGTIGDTGFETGPHLHFSIFDASTFTMSPRYGCGPEPTGKDEDPIPYLQNLN